MSSDDGSWPDLAICPPCLLRDHEHCDGDRFFCECLHDRCLPQDED